MMPLRAKPRETDRTMVGPRLAVPLRHVADHACDHCDLGDLAFCAGLPQDDASRLTAILGRHHAEAHETVFREGDAALHYFSIAAGTLKLYKLLPDGRRQITAFLFPGDFFGLALAGGYVYTAEAVTPATLCRFPRGKLTALMDAVPALEKRMLSLAVDELAAAHEQMLLLGRKTAQEKVASFLGMLAGRSPAGPSGLIDLPMSRSDIADYLGLTIETVSRTMTRLKRDGMIGLPDNAHVELKRPDELGRIADGG